ncbi:MAG: hypothetical protein AB1391_03495 [Candidatus Micrarchaeota archaeon]
MNKIKQIKLFFLILSILLTTLLLFGCIQELVLEAPYSNTTSSPIEAPYSNTTSSPIEPVRNPEGEELPPLPPD